MPFTVDDYMDLLRLLSDHPEWRVELRRALIPDDFVALPDIVRRLAEAQERTEERGGRLEEAMAALAEAQRRTEERLGHVEERVGRLEEAMAALAEAQRRTEERVGQLAEAQRKAEERLERVEGRLDGVEKRLGYLTGRELERHYRGFASAYFGRFIRRVRMVNNSTLADMLEDVLSEDDVADALRLDLVMRGRLRRDGAREVMLAVEISEVIDPHDVERVVRRADLIRRAGYDILPVVAGEDANPNALQAARARNVAVVTNGHKVLWDDVVAAWMPPADSASE